jgi:hypothetical protein
LAASASARACSASAPRLEVVANLELARPRAERGGDGAREGGHADGALEDGDASARREPIGDEARRHAARDPRVHAEAAQQHDGQVGPRGLSIEGVGEPRRGILVERLFGQHGGAHAMVELGQQIADATEHHGVEPSLLEDARDQRGVAPRRRDDRHRQRSRGVAPRGRRGVTPGHPSPRGPP